MLSVYKSEIVKYQHNTLVSGMDDISCNDKSCTVLVGYFLQYMLGTYFLNIRRRKGGRGRSARQCRLKNHLVQKMR